MTAGLIVFGYGYAVGEPESRNDGKWALQVQVVA